MHDSFELRKEIDGLISIIGGKEGSLITSVKEYLRKGYELIYKQHRLGASGSDTVRAHTYLVDRAIKNIFEKSWMKSCGSTGSSADGITLIATGGYGRGELYPYSDIDLLFIHRKRISNTLEKIAKDILYILWDSGLDVGYSIKTISNCIKQCSTDFTVRTSLLDSRYLAGDRDLYRKFEDDVMSAVYRKRLGVFIEDKLKAMEMRHRKYGDTVYILEPHIKDGKGGLRDIHAAIWISRLTHNADKPQHLQRAGLLLERERRELEEAWEFVRKLRCEIHYLSGRKNDQLIFEFQEKIARNLGYFDDEKTKAVEKFISDYYRHASNIHYITGRIIERCLKENKHEKKKRPCSSKKTLSRGIFLIDDEIHISNEHINEDPLIMLDAFYISDSHGIPISSKSLDIIRERIHFFNEDIMNSSHARDIFFKIINGKNPGKTLSEMNKLGILQAMIPEFGKLFCKAQYDLYHVYTIDTHSIYTVCEIKKVLDGKYEEEFPLLTQIGKEIRWKDVLVLSCLLHDIGKGEGNNHSERGATIVRNLGRKWNMPEEKVELLEFLVRNHLYMSEIAQRRDLHDPKLVLQFSKAIGDVERLKYLYLLTFSDLRAVGPRVWNEWKGMLLQELYLKAYEILESGEDILKRLEEKGLETRREVERLLSPPYSIEEIDEFLDNMSPSYLISTTPSSICKHFLADKKRSSNPLLIEVESFPDKGYSEVIISTDDRMGLFSIITGCMAANSINILGAQIYTGKDGRVIDVFQVNSPLKEAVIDERKWKVFEKDLLDTLEGRIKIEELLARKRKPSFVKDKVPPKTPTRIEMDNTVSDAYTVIDIYTVDRVGLLYDITSTMAKLGLYIFVAKISTKVDQVADVFYVRDKFGWKIMDQGRIEDIKRELYRVIDGI